MARQPDYRSLRGMPDILPKCANVMFWAEKKAREVFQCFGYGEIRTPLLEETEVFTRSIGADTDIVEKEMYSFTDRGGKNVSLRPEGTAPIVRAFIEHGWHNTEGLVKLFYSGSMFRGERPQKGRLREFHQIGAEIIGGSNPYIDAEAIISLCAVLAALKVDDFKIQINSLGCRNDRVSYKEALTRYLKKRDSGLCDNCKRRSGTNVLRVLDCKRPSCKSVVEQAPGILDYLCEECGEEYSSLKEILADMGISFCRKKDLVRGLDYYTGIIFEVSHPALGSQDALAAGGRYDGLVKKMGGPDVGATGYAIGMERLAMVIDKKNISTVPPGLLIVPVDETSRREAFRVLNRFWVNGVVSQMDHFGRSLKGQLRKAHKDGRDFVVIIGEKEIKEEKMVLKEMESGEQKTLSFEEVIVRLKERELC